MLKIKFIKPENEHVITKLQRISDHVVALDCGEQNTSGFYAYTDGKLTGKFLDYTTIYKATDELVYFSNNGSKWVDPTTTIKAVFDSVEDLPYEVNITLENGETTVLYSNSYTRTMFGVRQVVASEEVNKYHSPVINDNVITYTHKSPKEIIQEEIDKYQAYLDSTDKVPAHMSDIEYNARYVDHKTEEEIEALKAQYYAYKAETYKLRQEAREKIEELRKKLEVAE